MDWTLMACLLTVQLPLANGRKSVNLAIDIVDAFPVSLYNPTVIAFRKVPLPQSLFEALAKSGRGFVKQMPFDRILELTDDDNEGTMIFLVEDPDSYIKSFSVIDSLNLGRNKPVIILKLVSGMTLPKDDVKIPRINQEVFEVDVEKMEVTCSYQVNNHIVDVIAGSGAKSQDGLQFIPTTEGWHQCLAANRDNFYGKQFQFFTDKEPPSTILDPDFEQLATFHPGNQTYDVTDFLSGVHFDIIRVVAYAYNFTFKIAKRKDGDWGSTVNNQPTGLLLNLDDGTADLILASYGMLDFRLKYARYLPVVLTHMPAIFIGSNDQVEEFNWILPFKPFTSGLWITICFVAIVLGTLLFIMDIKGMERKNVKKPNSIQSYLGYLWITLIANFGGAPESKMSLQNGGRILVFTCLIVGNVVWIGYRASITSELSNTKVEYPFQDLDTLLETIFVLGSAIKSASESLVFTTSKPGSIYYDIWKSHMTTDDSFVQVKTGLDFVLSKPHYAYFHNLDIILGLPEYDCKITRVWQSTSPLIYYAYAMPRNSEFYKPLFNAILKIEESGAMDAIKDRYFRQLPNCDYGKSPYKALGVRKLVMLFFLLFVALLLAVFILSLEIRFHDIIAKTWIGHIDSKKTEQEVTMLRKAIHSLQKAASISNHDSVVRALGDLNVESPIGALLFEK